MPACLRAKKGGTIGTAVAVIGHLMVASILILLAIAFGVPSLAYPIFSFLYFWGWILGIVGGVLSIIGIFLRTKEKKACYIV
jgi:hypothetical protein